MSEQDLVADLKESLFDSADVFASENDTAFKRLLAQALPDMAVKRPITRLASFPLVAGTDRYLVPVDNFAQLKIDLWRDARKQPKPWDPCWPGPLPLVSAQQDEDGWWIVLDPAPSAAHLAAMGSTFKFYYFAHHAIGADASGTTVAAADRGLLLLRAQAEAMLAIAVRNAGKPVQLRESLTGVARNSTPSALYDALMKRFWEAR